MSYLNEKEIIDYLMTSDFNEGLTQEESRFLLLKFRYHYRLLFARTESQSYLISDKKIELDELKQQIETLNNRLNQSESELHSEINRKLTWRERIIGKKITK